jgi:anti-anti-sigma factor
MIFFYEMRDRSDGTCLSLSGEIDLSVREELRGVLDGAIAASPGITNLDLRDLTLLDCSGIGVFVHAHVVARQRGSTLTVSRPQGVVLRLLDLSGVSALLTHDHETGWPPSGAARGADSLDH